ncbi:MAG: amidohydrolase family protein [Methanothrix sp.]|jgi:cytosine/adenosine deaminase-related metal-dependent hydrolase|uniref:Amidohydrolase n=1 Tax=Methanothrix harundinacea TaxID=301375 RepID=A0A117LFP6_9EURY|nr:MAG: Amidohydrolase [Methanothrix harundinacea]MDD2637877.1 amidohydrolase family protein [Methanothrix sp.]MDI9400008.1 amidohydrolase family protein [Euryarchaeota archaeon]KUK95827.1 MAG: Amidohydrolase [Methanothrix harundinacea]MDD3709181.1 amidohydrolase family protein [Methanothrix sp.]
MVKTDEVVLSGTILLGEEFEPFEGHLILREGVVAELGSERIEPDFEGIISPALVNAHVHLGDSIFKDPPYIPLNDLVGPGGLKQQALASASRQDLVEGMKRSLSDMARSGTCAFADFREGGIEGVEMLLEAMEQVERTDGVDMIGRVLGRPDPGSARVHQKCWGIGISSTRDHPPSWVEEVVEAARAEGKKVALHAGEAGRDDIEDALSLEPDLLVHLTKAEPRDLARVAEAEVPVVVCPRSNLVTGVGLPNVSRMLEMGIVVGLGTDNVMLNSPNLFTEMEFLSKALLHNDRQVFMMCTLNGARILGADDEAGPIRVGKKCRIMVIDRRSENMVGAKDPLASLVRRARPSDVLAVL